MYVCKTRIPMQIYQRNIRYWYQTLSLHTYNNINNNVCLSSSDDDHYPKLPYFDDVREDGYRDQSAPQTPFCSKDRKRKKVVEGLEKQGE